MASVYFYQNADMLNPNIWYGTVTSATASSISLTDYSGNSGTYYGSFSYSGYSLAGGTLTGYDSNINYGLWFTVRNVSLNALVVKSYLDSGNAIGLEQYALASNDTISGSVGADILLGWGGDDLILGADGDDYLYGGTALFKAIASIPVGDDYLYGGTGADSLIGGADNDYYFIDTNNTVVTENDGEGTDTVNSSITYTLGANLENLTLIGTGAINGTGNTLNNILTGNAGDNMLDGGAGSDGLNGGSGNDTLDGGVLDDYSPEVIDILSGDTGNDTFLSRGFFETGNYAGGDGADWIDFSQPDTYTAGRRNAEGAGVKVDLAAGTASTYYLQATNYTWLDPNGQISLATIENINGTAQSDILNGDSHANLIMGNDGDDYLYGGAGFDSLVGGAGNDIYIVDDSNAFIIENYGEETDTVNSSITYTLGANLENLTLTGTGAIKGTGNTLNNILTGNAGDNMLDGGAGSDALNGGSGNDTLDGGVLDDYSPEVIDILSGDTGNDTFLSRGFFGTGHYAGGDGADWIDFSQPDTYTAGRRNAEGAGVKVDLAAGTASTYYLQATNYTWLDPNGQISLATIENINGTAQSDILNGDSHGNLIMGNDGDDYLYGSAGFDSLIGGAGNDSYIVDDSNAFIIENYGEGTDTVNSSITYTLGANLENITLTGTGAMNGTGNTLNNILTGNTGANTLNGGTGVDSLIGGAGNDTYIIDNSGDVITENYSEGTDTVNSSITYILGANLENLTLTGTGAMNGTGNSLANSLVGNSGVNSIIGGAGNDILNGGLGKDTLTGGQGADTFRFNAITETGITTATRDIIIDFKHSQRDKIDLSAIDANLAVSGNNAFSTLIVGGSFSGSFTGPGKLYFDRTAHILYGNNDTDSTADFSIQMTGVADLAAADFVL